MSPTKDVGEESGATTMTFYENDPSVCLRNREMDWKMYFICVKVSP